MDRIAALALALVAGLSAGPRAWRQEEPQPTPAFPPSDALDAARAELRAARAEAFARARDRAGRGALARALLAAGDPGEDALGRCARLVEARELAVEAVDCEVALEAADRLAAAFALDPAAERRDVVLRLAALVKKPETAAVARAGFALVEDDLERDPVRREDLQRATEVFEALDRKVRQWGDAELEARRARLQEALAEHATLVTAFETLATSPDDPEANRRVGYWRAFARGELERGLEHLARGPEDALTECARRDLARPAEPAARFELGDAWLAWSRTRTGRTRDVAEARAHHWFALAAPGLDGDARLELEKRLRATTRAATRTELGVHSGRGEALGLTPEVDAAVVYALDWLLAHQSENGAWDCDGFARRCPTPDECGPGGSSTHDPGVTGLALLALLARGDPGGDEPIDRAIARGFAWLLGEQDPETGLIGERQSHDWVYDHAAATLALAVAHRANPEARLGPALERAIEFVLRARNPGAGWRYDFPPAGENDTSVTAWMVAGLVAAREAGVAVDALLPDQPRAFEDARAGALGLLDALTDPKTGRTGYAARGEQSSRTPANEHFSRDLGETMTAAGLASRLLLGQPGKDRSVARLLDQQADLVARLPPEWRADGQGNDVDYWYYGTRALHGLRADDPQRWSAWNRALEKALLGAQAAEGHAAGSWAPNCVWGYVGGRVYSTAMAVLALTVPLR